MAKRGTKIAVQHTTAVHAVVELNTFVKTAVKTLAILVGATALAAAAAYVSVPQVPTYLTVSVASKPSTTRQLYGTPNVPFLGLQMKTNSYPVALKVITFTFITDTDGSFTNGVANNLDPASAITQCTLVDNTYVRVSGPVALIPGQKTITFNSTYTLPPNTTGGVGVLCDLSPSSPGGVTPDALALTVASRYDIAISSVNGDVPSEGISMTAPLNNKGASITILRNRPLQAVGSTSSAPSNVLTVTAIPSSPSIFIVPGATKIEAARFRYDGPAGSVVHSIHVTAACTSGACQSPMIARARLSYVDATGATVVTPAIANSYGAWNFDGLNIKAAPSATVSVLIDATGFTSANVGSTVTFTLSADTSLNLPATPSGENVVFAKSLPVLSLAAGSPSGPSSRGMNPVLSFNIRANQDGPVDISELAFKVMGTEGDITGWLSCKNLGVSSKWGLRDAANPNVRLEDAGDWVFYQQNGKPCTPTATLGYAVVDFARSGDKQAKAIGASQTANWTLRVDTSGALSGNTLTIIMPSQSETASLPMPGFAWSDTWTSKLFDGSGIPGLPLTGGTLSF